MREPLRRRVERELETPITEARRMSGGDINDAFELRLGDVRRVFVKTHAAAPPGMFDAEASGLAWLAGAHALRVPEVLAVTEEFLVLEWLAPSARTPSFDEQLGRGLAALHRAGAPRFGLERDNFIGPLPQANSPMADWSSFYRVRRLEPQLELAIARGRASFALQRGFERLLAHLDDRLGPPEPPARLHGDLWGGNVHVDEDGAPCLIDPAVYGGHREIDLAMLRLFGGASARCFEAYHEVFPLAPGHAERIGIYQLYPLLVHLNLFGVSYERAITQILARL